MTRAARRPVPLDQQLYDKVHETRRLRARIEKLIAGPTAAPADVAAALAEADRLVGK